MKLKLPRKTVRQSSKRIPNANRTEEYGAFMIGVLKET